MAVRRVLGTVVAAVIVVTGVVLWQGGADAQSSPAQTHRRGAETLGPVGYRKLRMGMTRAQVRHTHQARVLRRHGTCSGIKLRAHRPGKHAVSGYVSARYGLVAIFAAGPMHTPEGIRLGSTRKRVLAAYPHLRDGIDGSYARVRGHRGLEYAFLFEGRGRRATVYELGLISKRQDCFN